MADGVVTYSLAITINSAAFTAPFDFTPHNLLALDPQDDSRHSDTDGIARVIGSGRFEYSEGSIKAKQVTSGCPGIAAAIAAIGTSVNLVVTRKGGTGVTTRVLVLGVEEDPHPLSGTQAFTIKYKPNPVHA